MSATSQAPAVRVPLLDLKAQYRTIAVEVMQAVEAVCDSQHFILGPQVSELEQSIARYSQCAFGVGTSSGTDALLLALMALGVGQGDAIVTSPYSFFATAGTIARLGARPLFCDIDPDTFNLSPASVRALLEDCEPADGTLVHRPSGTTVKAILPVHLFGQVADMQALCGFAKEAGLAVVEDAAQAIGAESPGGRRAGSFGDVGCFSFFPTKNLGGFGDGGLCTTHNPALAERMRVLRAHGGKPKYHHAEVGGNFRLDELQAAVLNVKLRYLDGWTAARQRNARRYDEALGAMPADVRTPFCVAGGRHVYNQYVIRARERDALRAHLAEQGIGTEIYYPVPLHLQICFASLGYREEDCPESAAAARESLALPIYPELQSAQIERVIHAIEEFYRP
jgi:dTDP-4-amino-4,6-dideoxygalactose transaminase